MYGQNLKKIGWSMQWRTSLDAQRTIVLKRPPRITTASIHSPGTDIQDLPANRFSLKGEEDFEPDRPWKRNRRDSDVDSNNSTSDYEDNRTKGKRIHWVSNDGVALLPKTMTMKRITMKRMMVKMMRDIMENMRVSEIIHSIVMNIYGMNGYSEQTYKWMRDKV